MTSRAAASLRRPWSDTQRGAHGATATATEPQRSVVRGRLGHPQQRTTEDQAPFQRIAYRPLEQLVQQLGRGGIHQRPQCVVTAHPGRCSTSTGSSSGRCSTTTSQVRPNLAGTQRWMPTGSTSPSPWNAAADSWEITPTPPLHTTQRTNASSRATGTSGSRTAPAPAGPSSRCPRDTSGLGRSTPPRLPARRWSTRSARGRRRAARASRPAAPLPRTDRDADELNQDLSSTRCGQALAKDFIDEKH